MLGEDSFRRQSKFRDLWLDFVWNLFVFELDHQRSFWLWRQFGAFRIILLFEFLGIVSGAAVVLWVLFFAGAVETAGEERKKERRNSLVSFFVSWSFRGEVLMKGSLTVEAALVIPFSFMILGVICLLGVFQYNQAVVFITGRSYMYEVLDYREHGNAFMEQYLEEQVKAALAERTIGLKEIQVEAKVSTGKIYLHCGGQQKILFSLSVEKELEKIRLYPEPWIRQESYRKDQ